LETPPSTPPGPWTVRAPDQPDRDRLATVVLDAYRGTVDDEGEDHEAALVAVDDWLSRADGNAASARLFADLGFVRVGAWGRAPSLHE
jgi:hypothetical protein